MALDTAEWPRLAEGVGGLVRQIAAWQKAHCVETGCWSCLNSTNLCKKTTDDQWDTDYFKSMMSSSEEAMSWKGLLPEPGLPSLSTTGSCSGLVEWLWPSGLASDTGLSKIPDGILEERSCSHRMGGPRWRAGFTSQGACDPINAPSCPSSTLSTGLPAASLVLCEASPFFPVSLAMKPVQSTGSENWTSSPPSEVAYHGQKLTIPSADKILSTKRDIMQNSQLLALPRQGKQSLILFGWGLSHVPGPEDWCSKVVSN